MRFIADLHIHSHYSISTSPQLTPEHLDAWARIKGIGVIGTGDFTHPGWLGELKQKLEPAEEGLMRLKREYRIEGGEAGLPLPIQESHEVSGTPGRIARPVREHDAADIPVRLMQGRENSLAERSAANGRNQHVHAFPHHYPLQYFRGRCCRALPT